MNPARWNAIGKLINAMTETENILGDEIVSVPRAAAALGIKPTAMHELLDRGKIPYITPGVGGQRRVRMTDVYLYQQKVTHRGPKRLRISRLTDDPLRD